MKAKKYFSVFSILTLIFFYLVVIAGAVVRSSGSGMGCPDWPRCFEKWVPPTSVKELPKNYKEIYSKKRHKKIVKFSNLLEGLGMVQIANRLKNDLTLLEEEDFSVFHTWTEYLNRLIGFFSGNFMLAAFVISLFLFKYDRLLAVFSFINLIVLVFQAWLGSVVVATNLTPWIITVHMLLALVLIGVQIKIIVRFRDGSGKKEKRSFSKFEWFLLCGLALSLIQVVFGTQVRQEIDAISSSLDGNNRELWIDQLSYIFPIHRSFSILVLLVNGILIYLIYLKKGLTKPLFILVLILVVEVLSGVVMAYFSVPKFAQPIHLVLAFLLFGYQLGMLLNNDLKDPRPSIIPV